MEEILPAARLLRRATAVAPANYERVKAAFLERMTHAGISARQLGRQVCVRRVVCMCVCVGGGGGEEIESFTHLRLFKIPSRFD